jgi:hypothetical protein
MRRMDNRFAPLCEESVRDGSTQGEKKVCYISSFGKRVRPLAPPGPLVVFHRRGAAPMGGSQERLRYISSHRPLAQNEPGSPRVSLRSFHVNAKYLFTPLKPSSNRNAR